MNAPTAAPELTKAQQEAQDTIERGDYVAMLRKCLPTLKAEHAAGAFLLAEMTKQGDVQAMKKQFMNAARKITGGMPPMTEVALQLIASQRQK